jgi:hypothetical protein
MAIRETVRPSPLPPPLPSRQGFSARPASAARDERGRQVAPAIQPLEPHWDAAIDAATD